MSDIRVVLCVLALAPGLAFAQSRELQAPPLVEVEDSREADTPVREEARPSAEAVTEARWAPEPPERVAGRVLLESMGGAVAGVGGGFVGILAVLPFYEPLTGCDGDSCNGESLVGGALVGWSLGAALGVYGSGAMMDGKGRLLPTVGLSLLVGGATAGLYMSDVVGDETAPLLLALPLATSIITYEVTSSWERQRPSASVAAARPDGVWWTPTVGVTPHGGALGLAGHF